MQRCDITVNLATTMTQSEARRFGIHNRARQS